MEWGGWGPLLWTFMSLSQKIVLLSIVDNLLLSWAQLIIFCLTNLNFDIREHVKKIHSSASAKTSPHPRADSGHSETGFGSKGKILQYFKKIFRFLTDTPAKRSHNIFAYSFVSEHSKHFLFEKKTRTRPLKIQDFFMCSI